MVPVAPPVQHTDELLASSAPLEVHVYAAESAVASGGAGASFEVIEDDGTTHARAPRAALRRTTFRWVPEESMIAWLVAGGSHTPPTAYTHVRFVLFRPGARHVVPGVHEIGSGGNVTVVP